MKSLPKLTLLSLALTLAGCGGSLDTAINEPPPSGVIPPPGKTSSVVIGTITGFGSVYVDGVRYDVDNNTVVSAEDEEDVVGDDSTLAIGMKVKLYASSDSETHTAERIEYDDDLEGVIEAITPDAANPLTGTITVLGQTVIIDEFTAFDSDVGNNDANPGIDFRDLQVGMSIEVSGYPTDTGLLATRIDRSLDNNGNDKEFGNPEIENDEIELKGYVDSVADDFTSIVVNGITFFMADTTVVEDNLIIDQNLVGAYVEVEADIVNGEYILTEIEREDNLSDDDYEREFEIEGILQAIDTSSDIPSITINGLVILVNDVSSLEGLIGQKVEVEGSFNENDVLIISEIEVEVEESLETEDAIIAIDTENKAITTRLGLVISLTGASRIEDDATDSDDNLSVDEFLAQLAIGDMLKAHAVENSDGSYSWTKVERIELAEDALNSSCELSGYVTEITGDETDFGMYIGGVLVSTSRTLDSHFRSGDEITIGRTYFFNQLQVGMEVEAESFEGDAYCTEGLLDAEEVELENDDS